MVRSRSGQNHPPFTCLFCFFLFYLFIYLLLFLFFSVLVEAVKCLCNLVLNNHHLAKTLANLRALHALKGRLALCSAPSTRKLLRHDVLFFDLRLIFLVTACGPEERCVHTCVRILGSSFAGFIGWLFQALRTKKGV